MKIISDLQDKILKGFGELKDSDQFYLTGGTALAHFYLKHRQSNDLDFFTSIEDIMDSFSRQLENYLKRNEFVCERRRGLRSFVELVVSFQTETTLIHLAVDSAFRFEATREFPEYPKLRVDSLIDIASNKLLALFGRAALRDFIDVYFLARRGHFSKKELMNAAVQKDPGFDLYWLGVAFERIHTFHADAADILLLIEPVSLEDLKKFFDQWRGEIVKELKP